MQRAVLHLSDEFEIANDLAEQMLSLPPIINLFSTHLFRTTKDGSTAIQIDFGVADQSFPIRLKKDGTLVEAATIPSDLANPRRGVIAQFGGIGFPILRPHQKRFAPLPEDLKISCPTDHIVEIHVESAPAEPTTN